MFDRFATLAAYYWFATTCHGGQWSAEYKIFGRLDKVRYKPGLAVEHGRLDHDAALIWYRLAAPHMPHGGNGYAHCQCRDCFETVIDAAFCDACSTACCGLNQECLQEDDSDESHVFTATAPACWASYLVNGDASGIDAADIEAADKFLAEQLADDECTVIGPTDVTECGFMHSTDGLSMGCDAAEYTFVRMAK